MASFVVGFLDATFVPFDRITGALVQSLDSSNSSMACTLEEFA